MYEKGSLHMCLICLTILSLQTSILCSPDCPPILCSPDCPPEQKDAVEELLTQKIETIMRSSQSEESTATTTTPQQSANMTTTTTASPETKDNMQFGIRPQNVANEFGFHGRSNRSEQYLTPETCRSNVPEKELCLLNVSHSNYTFHIFSQYLFIDYAFSQPLSLLNASRALNICAVCEGNNERSNAACVNKFTVSMFAGTQSRHDEKYVADLFEMLYNLELPQIKNVTNIEELRYVTCAYSLVTYANSSIYDRSMLHGNHLRSISRVGDLLTSPAVVPTVASLCCSSYEFKNQILTLSSNVIPTYVANLSNLDGIDRFDRIFNLTIDACITRRTSKHQKCICDYWLNYMLSNGIYGKVMEFLKIQPKDRQHNPIIKIRRSIEYLISNMPKLLMNSGHMSRITDYMFTNYRLYYTNIFTQIKSYLDYDKATSGDNYFRQIYDRLDDTNPLKLVLYYTFKDSNSSRTVLELFLKHAVKYQTNKVMVIDNALRLNITFITDYEKIGANLTLLIKQITKKIKDRIGFTENYNVIDITIVCFSSDEMNHAFSLGFSGLVGVYIPSERRIYTFDLNFCGRGILCKDGLSTLIHEFVHAYSYIYMPRLCSLEAVCEGIAVYIERSILYGDCRYMNAVDMIMYYVYGYNFSTYELPRDITVQALNEAEKIRNNYHLSSLFMLWMSCKRIFQLFVSDPPKYIETYMSKPHQSTKYTREFREFISILISNIRDNTMTIRTDHEKMNKYYQNTPFWNLFGYIPTCRVDVCRL